MATSHPFRSLLLGTVAAAGLALSAEAQMLDYGAMETMFEEPVTTSATGKPQRASEVPVAMDIVTAEQIRRSGAHDIPTVLARYTSLDVQQYNEQDYSVSARGLATPQNSRMLVLIDGRQVYQDDYGRTIWHLLPVQLTEIRQIEVVKGPNTALFGFNAVAGVVNIVTFNPGYDRVNNAVVRLGTRGYQEASGVATAPLGEGSGIRLSAGARTSTAWTSGFLLGETSRDLRQDPERYQFATNVVKKLGDTVQVSLDGSYSRSLATDLGLNAALSYYDTRAFSVRGRVAAETSIGLVEASAYHNGLDMTTRSVQLNQAVTVLQLSDTVKVGANHTFRPSFEYRHNSLDTGRGPIVGYSVVALGAMWNWAISDTLDLTLAGRRDQVWLEGDGYNTQTTPKRDALYNRDFDTYGYNAGLVWRATGADTLRVAASRGIGMPSLVDLGLQIVSPQISYVGNPTLKPTVVDNYEVGYRRRVESLDASFGITGFHQINRDMSSTLFALTPARNPGVGGVSFEARTIPTLDVTGVELSGRGNLPYNFNWGVEYRLASVAGSFDPTVKFDPKHASPRHLMSSRLGWSEGPFQADAFLRYASTASGYRAVNNQFTYVTVDDFASLGGRLAYRFAERFTLALEGSNVLTEKQRQSIGLQARRTLYASLRLDF